MKHILTLGCLLFATHAMNAKVVAETKSPITVKKGLSFVVTLESNPTNGSLWHLNEQPDGSKVRLEESHYTPDANPHGLVGNGGTQTWQFKALNEGDVVLKFAYKKSWETNERKPEKLKNITVKITK